METFTSYDGTELAFRTVGDGPPLLVLPGGPGRAAAYLGDLGGLTATRTLILPDTRGTGASAAPADPGTFRVDRLVDDVEALRRHLGLERVDLLGHSAGGGLALLYAAAHPDRLTRLVLAAPSLAAIGAASDLGAEQVIAARAAEPWYAEAQAAYRRVKSARSFAEAAPHRPAFEPLMYGRWDAAARAHAAADPAQRSLVVSEHYYAGYTPDTGRLRQQLAALPCPVLLLAGELDLWPTAASARAAAPLFPDVTLAVQPGSGHYPWLDDPAAFTATVEGFLRRTADTRAPARSGR
ncbi:alpha/beta hydrolase [Kitasatospora purpeofusca]|uniref:alpha/beta fold hydrolase n=1 Tax=Kitasatospora purpeofusca TaxID=67352 RepID=UPI002A5A17FC|nr:alpha/beta hydrolase [Kitasatospora purpeofusca]MDY0816425.1 alpha/beta hydrolase [Kitasatospora purpeofusca]